LSSLQWLRGELDFIWSPGLRILAERKECRLFEEISIGWVGWF